MHIRQQILNRDGEIVHNETLKQTARTREAAIAMITQWQQVFPVHGYNDIDDYWWGRPVEGEFRLNRWFIEGASY